MFSLHETISLYTSVGCRDSILFKWLYDNLYTKLRLSSVPPHFFQSLRLLKTKSAIFITLIDDIADNQELREEELLRSLLSIPFQESSDDIDNNYYRVVSSIWADIISTIEKYPRFSEFKDIFYFDLRQVMNSQEYSFLINTNRLVANMMDNESYGPHGTLVMLHGTIDLMCSPEFDESELGPLREVLIIAQKIAQLCNMINTYAREIEEGDISSPIIIDLISEKPDFDLPALKDSGDKFFERLEQNYEKLVQSYIREMKSRARNIKSVDVSEFAEIMRKIWEGYKERDLSNYAVENKEIIIIDDTPTKKGPRIS